MSSVIWLPFMDALRRIMDAEGFDVATAWKMLSSKLLAGEVVARRDALQEDFIIGKIEWRNAGFDANEERPVFELNLNIFGEALGPAKREDVSVRRKDIDAIWPSTKPDDEGLNSAADAENASAVTGKGRRGPVPEKRERVKAEMLADLQANKAVAAMKEEEMAATYQASRDTCRNARREALSEFTRKTPTR